MVTLNASNMLNALPSNLLNVSKKSLIMQLYQPDRKAVECPVDHIESDALTFESWLKPTEWHMAGPNGWSTRMAYSRSVRCIKDK